MNRLSERLLVKFLLLSIVLAMGHEAKAFASCSPAQTTITGLYPPVAAHCVDGHYFITMVGLSQLGLSTDTLKAIAQANIDVDLNETDMRFFPPTGGYSCSGTSQIFQLFDKTAYNPSHHFDRTGASETTTAAFARGASYLQDRRNAFIAAIRLARSCGDIANAFVILGEALHALQDVFSHSNYVDFDVIGQIDVNVAIKTATTPPSSFILTSYNPIGPYNEDPGGDPYSHCLKAKDFSGKNPESDLPDPNDNSPNPRTKYEAAKGYAILATESFVTSIANDLGPNDWTKVQQFGTYGSMCAPPSNHPIQIKTSGDPNDKAGSRGVGSAQYIARGTPLRYGIFFGNEPTASAAAQTVTISDPLPALDDLATFSFGPISFGNQVLTPSPGLTYSATVDLRPTTNLIVGVSASANTGTGLVNWKFTSLDPSTGAPTTDPTLGFLPPGGNGSVFFTVSPLQKLSTGTQVQNQATIVFDVNAPMNTPTWLNTIDNTGPTSHIAGLPATSSCPNFRVSWSGSDVGSGLQGFTVYASDNESPFAAWLSNTTAAAADYAGAVGHTYSFYSIATDLVGNVEVGKTAAEATTMVTSAGPCGPPSLSGQVSNVAQSGTTVTATLTLSNTGFTAAQAVNINQITFRTLSGSGAVTLASPTVPATAGTIAVGTSKTVTLTLNVPATVSRFAMTEGGDLTEGSGTSYKYSLAQTVIP